jgi:multidrug efflux pump subunit AcrA (membrane-fusion protein)
LEVRFVIKNKWVLSAVGILGAGLVVAWVARSPGTAEHAEPSSASPASSRGDLDQAAQTLALTAEDFKQFKVLPAVERVFSIQREAVGAIDFNQDMSTDVFPPVQGKILKLFASAGDDVVAGGPLYTIDSPDLVQAGSNLISAAGVLDLTTRALKRAKELREVEGISQRDYDQAVSDQQGAEAAFKAARDAVRIFGKTDKEIDEIVAQRKIDPVLVVRSPLTGRVTARNAAPGVLAQPGNPPAPLTVSDLSTRATLVSFAWASRWMCLCEPIPTGCFTDPSSTSAPRSIRRVAGWRCARKSATPAMNSARECLRRSSSRSGRPALRPFPRTGSSGKGTGRRRSGSLRTSRRSSGER